MASKTTRLTLQLADKLEEIGIQVTPGKLAPLVMASLHKANLELHDINPNRTIPQR